ncbi:phosphoribosylanthranilate isomerase [Nonlabens xiamenensis]|uniref:phosphoribosylanthranilate isomerase n=1 Tax=Nonlabens xiamenensis TaxID=2341043 RepID=UPI000F60F5EF|nr:phosphoribosylanthranilate isomerase [Nonlabens xiamenensis]
MMIKVCGMRELDNIQELQQLDLDFMGLIRYPKSKRFVNHQRKQEIGQLQMNKGTVGVYVNESLENILKDIIPLQLDVIQLHGDEDVAFAKAILELDLKVFKAISMGTEMDMNRVKEWSNLGQRYPGKFFLLFDTATPEYGGSGKKFDWSLLADYNGKVPFLLSGGLSPDDVEAVKAFKNEMFLGVDLNSGFELAPGVKDIEAIKSFIKQVRDE